MHVSFPCSFNSRLVRCLASGTYIIRTLLSLGVTIYTPTVALNTIIGVPYWVSLVSITVITIFFNALGGLKAAVAADVIQSLSMTAMLVGIIIYCSITVGGVDKILTISSDNGKKLSWLKVSDNDALTLPLFQIALPSLTLPPICICA